MPNEKDEETRDGKTGSRKVRKTELRNGGKFVNHKKIAVNNGNN